MNAVELRAHILGHTALKREEVVVPEWGCTVYVSEFTGAGRDAWEASLAGQRGTINISNVRARLVAATVVDAEGNRLFSDKDAEELGRMSSASLDKCAVVAQRLNGLTSQELEAAKGN